ncbi:MAG: hypothetical protein KDB79_01265 [Acidobacteria bacterium]|nr:hypothetical protein [Acidobacteriota bacterium]
MQNIVKVKAYGVKVGIEVPSPEKAAAVRDRLKGVLPNDFGILGNNEEVDHHFSIRSGKKSKYSLFKGDESICVDTEEDVMLDRLDSQVRITIAEFAVGNVFVHSGVVAIDGKAIMIPASSFKGKTTLVAELVKNGATYYSDEYAVLDEDGLVHPFAKDLSMRKPDGGGTQIDTPVETFGGSAGRTPIPVRMVLVMEFKKYARWKPDVLSRGQGVLEIISHTVPIRNDPAFSLTVLNKVVDNALIVKSKRGEVSRFAKTLIKYFKENVGN